MKASIWNNIKKAVAGGVSLAILLCCLSGCEQEITPVVTEYQETTVKQTVPEELITVPYTTLDSLNPFYSVSLLNASLFSLMYRSLYTLDSGFTPTGDISAGQTVSPLSITVTLKENVVFSDNTYLTSSDVVYSFNKAKTAALYKESLSGFDTCEADGTFSVVFTLKNADINALNVLTFPIVKNGTADTSADIPVGAGIYCYQKDELRPYLTWNMYYTETKPVIGTVRLCDVNNSSSLMHLLDTGTIDCFFTDLSDGTSKRTYAGANEVYLNNMVYLGFNEESYRLNAADVRKAISLSIDRRAVVENAYVSHARASDVPMNVSWDKVTATEYLTSFDGCADVTAANVLLSDFHLGYDGETVYYTMICPDAGTFLTDAAKQIVSQLANVNIKVTLNVLSANEFEKALQNGAYDMYLSEIKLCKNMDLSPFFSVGGSASYGLNADALTIDEAYFSYRAGDIDLNEFLTLFSADVPFAPICFRNGRFCYSKRISGTMECSENNLFGTIALWQIK